MALSHATDDGRLRGRHKECAALRRVVSTARSGESQVLVLRGDAGSGKTALLTYLASQLVGWHTLSVTGVESEVELAYSGLHQLCAPVLGRIDQLPGPQRDALTTVFGMSSNAAPDRFLVALATLTLLAEVAEDEPLACVVDDGQWLDQATAQILGFVARRLLAERIAFVCAARSGAGDTVLAGLPELQVAGLGGEDATALLLDNVPGPLDVAVVHQIVAESHGNPLAVLELPRTWSTVDLAGGFGLPDIEPVSSKIEQSYARRLASLPTDAQLFLLTAAAEPLGNPALLERAAGALGLGMGAAAPAAEAGLIRVGDRVEFTHPLVRSATYRAASRDDRHRVHRALAEATDADQDPDRRAWHRARATKTVDEEVADELERSAGRAQSRGGFAAAGAFLTRATELTPDPARRSERALGAALANVQAGGFEAARRMLTIAGDGPINDLQHAQIDLMRAQLAFASSRGTEAPPLLVAAARRLEAFDVGMARETYLDAFSAALFGARLNRDVGVAEIAAAARAAPHPPPSDVTAADRLLDGLVALADDYEAGVPLCQEAVQQLSQSWLLPPDQLRRLWQGSVVALEIWDHEGAYLLSQHHVELAREIGALSELALALSLRTPMLVFSGEIPAAVSSVAETQSVEESTGIAAAPYGALITAAWQGHSGEARRLIDETIQEVSSRGEGVGVAITEYTRAVLCNSAGHYDEALTAARSASEHREVIAENWALLELVESASRAGRLDLAEDGVERLAEKTRACGNAWAAGVEARSRALVAGELHAEDLFREAIECLNRTRVRCDLARAHLLFGEWLRRAHRPRDARTELTNAFTMFSDMGMEGFAERTRHELLAAGATVRKRSVDKREDLTPQEAQIARLAGRGLSNPEIGAQLFISARTVEWHLRKVFMKLGIASRRQLRTAHLDTGQPAHMRT